MSGESIDTLPDRPLTRDEITHIESESELQALRPVYTVKQHSETVVCVFGLTETNSAFYIYNPETGEWDVLFETELTESTVSDKGRKIKDEMRAASNEIEEYYDMDEVEFHEPDRSALGAESVLEDLVIILPETPLTRQQLREFRSEGEINELVPHTYVSDTDEVIAFTITYRTPNGLETAFLRYNNEMKTWVSEWDVKTSNMDDTEQVNENITAAYDVIEEQYDVNEIRGFTDKESIIEWWNN
jgi:hypothetical protein